MASKQMRAEMDRLFDFVKESNRIEGIYRDPTNQEIAAHEALVTLGTLVVADMECFVTVVQPGAILRREHGVNVRVGSHIAPPGGAGIEPALENLLGLSSDGDPYAIHHEYETLHPFTDGNGRSGRALWLRMMYERGRLDQALALGFLHNWYYQTLQHGYLGARCRTIKPIKGARLSSF